MYILIDSCNQKHWRKFYTYANASDYNIAYFGNRCRIIKI